MTAFQGPTTRSLVRSAVLAAAIIIGAGSAYADLYIRDDTSDTGAEPNPSTGPMWLSPDIWVRNNPLPGWTPRPYSITSTPWWADPTNPTNTNQDPDYASPLSGKPNYIYVRVRNRGTASTGNERLLVYWASASTGLAWDPTKVGGSFIDDMQGGVLFGSEITKVRKNAATATQAERDAYVAALRKIATDPAFRFPGGMSYWRTQEEIHRFGPTYRHGFGTSAGWVPSVAFLPWHREFINRFEGLLQEANPTVKLLYWQWTQDPTNAGIFDYSANFMGSFGAGSPPSAVPIGGPISPDVDAGYPRWDNGLATPTRRLRAGAPLAQPDATVVGRTLYDDVPANSAFSGGLESLSHNGSHVYIASSPNIPNNNTAANLATAGDQLYQPYAARDPFFFFLHAKVDELWARWQRKTLDNLDPASTYGTAAFGATITGTMGPWDGTATMNDSLPNNLTGTELDPWSVAGGQSYAKPANDRSVTSPPFYDTSPLTIPALQPGEEVIIEIPWYPPNPAGFGSIADPEHVCLIARIETSSSAPFGMTVAETTDINFNTNQNNNIAWRNVHVVDSIPGPFMKLHFLMANGFGAPIKAGLRFGAMLDRVGGAFFEHGGTVRVDLGRALFQRWKAAGGRAEGVEALAEGQLRISRPDVVLDGLELKPREQFPVQVYFDLKRDYKPTKPGEYLIFDVVQTGTPKDPKAPVGGQRYQVALDRLTPLERGRVWRWTRGDKRAPEKWTDNEFDDSRWYERKLDLGWVEPPGHGRLGSDISPTYYFRRTFTVEDPGFYRDLKLRIRRSDAAIVYLNGKEVYRSNLPEGAASVQMFARTPVSELERNVYFPVKLDPSLLRRGRNVLAVEIHRAEQNDGALTFDAEILANTGSGKEAPAVLLANVADGTLLTAGRVATINADALKIEGSIRSATLFVDDKPVQTLEKPPFSFKWPVQRGTHRLRVVVTDSDGMQSSAYATVSGVQNVPPTVEMIAPARHIEIAAGEAFNVAARAEDPDGKIVRVDFFVHDSYIIGAPGRLIGSVKAPPYQVSVSDLRVGHAMITAVAFDDGGARTAAIPIMVIVREKGAPQGHPH